MEKPTLYYIPHTHWEGAVFFTREEYLNAGLPHILTAVHLLQKYPDYRFTLDQVAYIKPFLERYPEEATAFKELVKEGRLGIVGGMDVMPDDVKQGGEIFVRQMQYGKGYCRKELGVDVTSAWLIDTFGHHPQMPQLLKLAGFKSLWFCRGVPKADMKSEFIWRGIDGSDVTAFWLPGFYGLFYAPPRDPAGFARFFEDRYKSLSTHTAEGDRVGLAGADVTEPEQYVVPLLRAFNARQDAPFTIRPAITSDFEKLVAKRKNLEIWNLDPNPIFQGTYSSRIELKQKTNEIERKLLAVEQLGALSNWFGVKAGDEEVWQAWEPTLFNQAHDLASGVMADHVYADTVESYDHSDRLADDLLARHWNTLVERVDTRGDGVPVVVYNTLGWPRTELVETDMGFAEQGVKGVECVDHLGNKVPININPTELYEDGGIRRATVSFLATNVPATGFATYHIIATETAPDPVSSTGNVMENEYYRLTIDLRTGAIASIFDKTTGMEMLSGPANVIARQEDKGDLWELYRTLDGASYVAMTNKQPVPTFATALLSTSFGKENGAIGNNPVYSEFHVAYPFANGAVSTRIRLCKGVRRIDIETELTNNEKYVRYQALFPTVITNGTYRQEIPFGSVERPIGIENPARTWVDYGNGKRGVTLLNFGMPGNLVNNGTLMLSLIRSQTLGDYNEGHTSDSGFALGVMHTFRYALSPHEGDWQKAEATRLGAEFNAPLIARKTTAHSGKLPSCWGLLKISDKNVALTSVKSGSGGSIMLRVYETTGAPAKDVRIKLETGCLSASETNLLEESVRKLTVKNDAVVFDLKPFQIMTIKVKVQH